MSALKNRSKSASTQFKRYAVQFGHGVSSWKRQNSCGHNRQMYHGNYCNLWIGIIMGPLKLPKSDSMWLSESFWKLFCIRIIL